MPFHRVKSLLALTCALLADDWPQWLGPTRDNVSKEKVAPWTEAPKVVWKKAVAEGHSSPIVVGDRAYLHVRVAGKDEEESLALDARTGEDVWRRVTPRAPFKSPFGVGPRATPLVDGGRLGPPLASDGAAGTTGATGVGPSLQALARKTVRPRTAVGRASVV